MTTSLRDCLRTARLPARAAGYDDRYEPDTALDRSRTGPVAAEVAVVTFHAPA